MNPMQKLINEICTEKNIKINYVSKDWVMILQKEDKTKYIIGYKFPLNNHVIGQICDDKYALYDVLKYLNIPVAEYHILFKNYSKEEVISYAKQYNYNMVVKSNTGTCGNDMYHTTTTDDLFLYIDKLLAKHYSISISPYYDIKNEYRTILFNKQVKLFYGKEKPIITGDGTKTIYELLCEFNPYYFNKISKKEELNKLLAKDEKYEYNWQFNLSKGARPFYSSNEQLNIKIQELATKVVKELDLNFVSVDIIELVTGKLLVLEVNSGVMMENYIELMPDGKAKAKAIYSAVIDEIFK